MERLPHGYTNRTRRVGDVVEKRHRGPMRHQTAAREAAVLRALEGILPVPRVLDFEPEEPLLRLAWLEGKNGQALLESGRAKVVLETCGAFLREIGAVDVLRLGFLGEGERLIHGDYGPHNLLMAADGARVLGIVDWEWARRGKPVEDLAWTEWIVRYHHPETAAELSALFAGYGAEPPWAERQRAMLENCQRGLVRAQARGDEKVIASWGERLERTRVWR